VPPIAPGKLIQEGAPETVQAQPAPAITPTFALPPAPAKACPPALSVFVQGTEFCVKKVPDAEVNVTPGGSDSVTAPAWL
jgi:hypothetical protein